MRTMAAELEQRKNNKDEVPFEHYLEQYRKLDPQEAADRCGLEYDPEKGGFAVRMMGIDYRVSFPDFAVTTEEPGFAALRDTYPPKSWWPGI